MHSKFWRAFPRLKLCVAALVFSMLWGIFAEGFDARAFLWLVFGLLIIATLWMRNLMPNIDPRVLDPKGYDRRQSELRIATALHQLVEAVNSKDEITINHAMDQARAALDERIVHHNDDQT